MLKNEELNDIIYYLKLHNRVYFEADNESYECSKMFPKGYRIEHQLGYTDVANLTEARKEIRKLGKTLLCL